VLSKKITNAKRVGGVVQVVEHLSSKCEVLSSTPNTALQKKKKKKKVPTFSGPGNMAVCGEYSTHFCSRGD
jgi:hypothetical protein